MKAQSNLAAAPGTKSDRSKEADNDLVFSYKAMRNFIGFFGMLLPVILIVFTKESNGKFVEPSISDYYYTKNGDILVVLLSVLAVFLFTYKGYGKTFSFERILTVLAAICAIGVAFSPTGSISDILDTKNVIEIDKNSVHTAISFRGAIPHFLSAGVFFVSLAIISLRYFPMSDAGSMKDHRGKKTAKAKRNVVFRVCGWTMITCVAALILYFALQEFAGLQTDFPVVFLFETIAVIAFGISWLTKGETFWPDGEHYMETAMKDMKLVLKGDHSSKKIKAADKDDGKVKVDLN